MHLGVREIELAEKMGMFYHEKYGEKAAEHIQKIQFTELAVVGDKLLVEMKRPGLFIGRRGQECTELSEFLGIKLHIKEWCGKGAEEAILNGIPWDDGDYPDYPDILSGTLIEEWTDK